ncbi:Cupredoxin [Syncephalis plumigaleata]|nr:Cupredoxin [Syncephalis plumigaleata]
MAYLRDKRRFYSAEDILWDYAPSGQDMVYHRELTGPLAPLKHGDRRTYKKAVYRGYEDDTFEKRTPREDASILGPTIHAEVGDVIEVVFRNKAKETYSIHPHGVFYTPENEERAGPAQDDAGSILWMYHSHHDEAKDVNAGLVGSMIIYRRGWLRSVKESSAVIDASIEQLEELKHTPWAASVPDYPGTAPDVYPRATTRYYARDTDREFIVLINIFNENNTPYYFENMLLVQEGAVTAPTGTGDADAPGANMEQMRRHQFTSINGRVLGNLAGLTAQQGERVRWHLAALGTEDALHHIRWHGPSGTVTERGFRTNGVSLLPATFRTVDAVLDVAGRWIMNCQNSDHNERGLFTWYHVIKGSNDTIAKSHEATSVTDIKDQSVIDAQ